MELFPAKGFPLLQTFLSSAIYSAKKHPLQTIESLFSINILLHQKKKFILGLCPVFAGSSSVDE